MMLTVCDRLVFGTLVAGGLTALAHGGPAAVQRIETTHAILVLETNSGNLVGLQWKQPQLEVIREAKLGENFRLLLPRPDYEANYFNSRDQVVKKNEKCSDRVVLHYGPLKNEREALNVHVAYEIRDTGSQLEFSIQVDNPTNRKLAEVLYAIIGGQQGIGERRDTESLATGDYDNRAPRLFSQFIPFGHTRGIRFDSAAFSYPGSLSMGWLDVFNSKEGLGYYYANEDPETRVTALYTELHPYTKTLSPKDNWPRAAELPAGEPLGLTLGWINFPYTSQGSFRAGPIALQVHAGDWRAGARLYRTWFDRHFKTAEPNWLTQEMAWQAIDISGPEDVIRYRFKDLPQLAADAKRYGVTTLQISGWNSGGVDRGYPDFTPDPRLGTPEEWRRALAEIRAMGVHPLLFGVIGQAHTGTEAFRTSLSRYAVQGRWAPDWLLGGFGEATIGARDVSGYGRTQHRNVAVISPAHPAYREELIRLYLDRIQDGADGVYFEGSGFYSFLDFNPNLASSSDRSWLQGLQTTYEDLRRGARPINPDATLSALGSFDRAFPYIDASNLGMSTKDAGPMAQRYTFPQWTSNILVESPEDFDPVNNGLRYGLVWFVAPRQWTASMDEALMRPLSRYVREMIRIRKQNADLLFHSRFNDTLGATVIGDAESIRYSVFSPTDDSSPQRACVVVNFGKRQKRVTVRISGKEGRPVTISAPFEPDRVAVLPVQLTLPAHHAAVVVAKR